MRSLVASATTIGWLAACSGEPDCITFDDACTPLYAPEFEMIHARTLVPSCAQAGGFCHAADGNAAGMTLQDVEVAYQALIGGGRVIAGDASCSTLSKRLQSEESDFQMPPGNRLSPEVRCAIGKWIAAGAKR